MKMIVYMAFSLGLAFTGACDDSEKGSDSGRSIAPEVRQEGQQVSSDSTWRLIKIIRPWDGRDTMVVDYVKLEMDQGVFRLTDGADNVLFEHKYSIQGSKGPSEAIGTHLLNVESSDYYSFEIDGCVLNIYGGGDDMDTYVFRRENCQIDEGRR